VLFITVRDKRAGKDWARRMGNRGYKAVLQKREKGGGMASAVRWPIGVYAE